MATIKSFTDISQSKKLTEILPIDSADMTWCNSSIKGINYTDSWHAELKTPIEIETIFNNAFGSDWKTWWSTIPCWSLAALLSVIPQEIFDGEYVINITEGCDDRWVLTYDHCENRHHSYYGLSSGADNLVDACYETILKLHEQKLI